MNAVLHYRNLPVKRKLYLIIMGIVGAALTLACAAVGGEGIVSVVGQAAPKPMRALIDLARAGKMNEALVAHQKLMPLFRAAFLESNPGPIKYLLSEMGLIANELRLPLVPIEPATEKAVLEAARAVGIALGAAAGRPA